MRRMSLVAAVLGLAAQAGARIIEADRISEGPPLMPAKAAPENRGRRAEKDAARVTKAEAKRARKAAKRAVDVVGQNSGDEK